MLMLLGLLYLIEKELLVMFSFESTELLVLLGIAIIVVGVSMNLISTYFSVNQYLVISEDKLYS
jgi:hypothetical protein